MFTWNANHDRFQLLKREPVLKWCLTTLSWLLLSKTHYCFVLYFFGLISVNLIHCVHKAHKNKMIYSDNIKTSRPHVSITLFKILPLVYHVMLVFHGLRLRHSHEISLVRYSRENYSNRISTFLRWGRSIRSTVDE